MGQAGRQVQLINEKDNVSRSSVLGLPVPERKDMVERFTVSFSFLVTFIAQFSDILAAT